MRTCVACFNCSSMQPSTLYKIKRSVMMDIIYPLFTLVMFTITVGFCLGASRLFSVKKRHVDRRYYRLMSGYEAPEYVQKLSRNFTNLLELPILFYVLAVLTVALNINSSLINALAWGFVSLRLVHSCIHIFYNNPKHRFYSYLFSAIILLVMWLELIIIISDKT